MNRGALISVVLSASLLVMAAASSRVVIDDEQVRAYHESIRDAAAGFPMDSGLWIGREVELPPSATKLLRPNAIIARRYQSTEHEGVSATLMVVQCADIRDMQGHYPPNCYPAHGWGQGDRSDDAAIGDLPALRYEFIRRSERGELGITVYNLFILPSGEVTTSMRDVRRAGSDYEARPFGAAQIQIVLDKDVPAADHEWILSEMRRIADPVVEALMAGAPAVREGAGQ
ncbi:MAG: exosortase-associated EpsI family protein [Planctomycetota bacterium]